MNITKTKLCGIDTSNFFYFLNIYQWDFFPPNFSKCFVSYGIFPVQSSKDVNSIKRSNFQSINMQVQKRLVRQLQYNIQMRVESWNLPSSPLGKMTLGMSSILAKLRRSRRQMALRQQPPGGSSPQRPCWLHHTCNGRG